MRLEYKLLSLRIAEMFNRFFTLKFCAKFKADDSFFNNLILTCHAVVEDTDLFTWIDRTALNLTYHQAFVDARSKNGEREEEETQAVLVPRVFWDGLLNF